MANEPLYWNDLRFVDLNQIDADATEPDIYKLRKLVGGRAFQLALLRAENNCGLPLFQELKARIEDNCSRNPYASPSQEATRMAWARKDLAESHDAAHLISASWRLHEGKDG